MKKNTRIPWISAQIVLVAVICFLSSACAAKTAESVRTTAQDLEAKAKEIHARILSVDTHCDTAGNLLNKEWNIAEPHVRGQKGFTQIDLPKMKEGGLDAEFFAAFVGQGPRTDEGNQKAKERALAILDAVNKMCQDHSDLIGRALTPDDAYRLKKQGKLVAFLSMENGYPIGKNVANVEEFYNKGVRLLSLCHSGDNDLCASSGRKPDAPDYGLTDLGKEVVTACNRLGIIVDVSHLSDKTFYDIIAVSKAPIIASHSGCRALVNSNRDLTDDQLRALAKNGGVIQTVFLGSYLKDLKPNLQRDAAMQELTKKYGPRRQIKDEAILAKLRQEREEIDKKYPQERATVEDIVNHIDHVVKTVGIDFVGLGTDFDGGGDIAGCEDASQMRNVTVELLKRGYSEKDIEKIWGGNVMRVFKKVMEVAKKG